MKRAAWPTGGRPNGVQDLYGSLRPVVSLATVIVQTSPVVWLVAHFRSLPRDAFWRAWFLEPEVFVPYWLATSLVIWASFVTLLVLARWPSPAVGAEGPGGVQGVRPTRGRGRRGLDVPHDPRLLPLVWDHGALDRFCLGGRGSGPAPRSDRQAHADRSGTADEDAHRDPKRPGFRKMLNPRGEHLRRARAGGSSPKLVPTTVGRAGPAGGKPWRPWRSAGAHPARDGDDRTDRCGPASKMLTRER